MVLVALSVLGNVAGPQTSGLNRLIDRITPASYGGLMGIEAPNLEPYAGVSMGMSGLQTLAISYTEEQDALAAPRPDLTPRYRQHSTSCAASAEL